MRPNRSMSYRTCEVGFMKMIKVVILTGCLLGLYSGCSGTSEVANIRIVNSKHAFVSSDSLTVGEYPPRGMNVERKDGLSVQTTDRRFFRAEDTISVDRNAEPKLIISPKYPDDAKKRFMEGTVWLRLWVTKEGHVKRARVEESTDVIFNESALTAGMNCIYSPAIKNNIPIDVSVYQPFHFKLGQNN